MDGLTAQSRTTSAEKSGVAAGWKVVSANAGTLSKEIEFSCELEGSSARVGT